jgi:hypothetical protein
MSLARRTFLALSTAAIVVPARVILNEEVPPLLDHILLGSNELQQGIDFVEQRTGVRAAFGGVHPGRGTQNALLSLGTGRYLEIIAPDPEQHTENPLAKKLLGLSEPRLVGWAAHPGDIAALAAKLKLSGIVATGPTPGSRKRPDGRVLHWHTLNLRDDADGLLPFFIEWSEDSPHPSADAPSGCRLLRFELLIRDPSALAKTAAVLSLDAPIIQSDSSKLHAAIAGPHGQLDVRS